MALGKNTFNTWEEVEAHMKEPRTRTNLTLERYGIDHDALEYLYRYISGHMLHNLVLNRIRCTKHGEYCPTLKLDLSKQSQLRQITLTEIPLTELTIDLSSLEKCEIGWIPLSKFGCLSSTLNQNNEVVESEIVFEGVTMSEADMTEFVETAYNLPQIVSVQIFRCTITRQQDWKAFKEWIKFSHHVLQDEEEFESNFIFETYLSADGVRGRLKKYFVRTAQSTILDNQLQIPDTIQGLRDLEQLQINPTQLTEQHKVRFLNGGIGVYRQDNVFIINPGISQTLEDLVLHGDSTAVTVHYDDNLTEPLAAQGLPIYRMDRNPRGWCVILNDAQFYPEIMSSRNRTEKDAARLEVLFDSLGFVVRRHDNLTDMQMMNVMTYCAQKVDHTNFDCFVCCVLTHGDPGILYGSNRKPISIMDVTSMFQANRCPTLAGKPKLFFFQWIDIMEVAGGDLQLDTAAKMIPNEADFLLGYSTVPSNTLFSNTYGGYWYIKELFELLEKHANSYDLMSILIEVNNKVATENDTFIWDIYKPIPVPLVTLRKRLLMQHLPKVDSKDTREQLQEKLKYHLYICGTEKPEYDLSKLFKCEKVTDILNLSDTIISISCKNAEVASLISQYAMNIVNEDAIAFRNGDGIGYIINCALYPFRNDIMYMDGGQSLKKLQDMLVSCCQGIPHESKMNVCIQDVFIDDSIMENNAEGLKRLIIRNKQNIKSVSIDLYTCRVLMNMFTHLPNYNDIHEIIEYFNLKEIGNIVTLLCRFGDTEKAEKLIPVINTNVKCLALRGGSWSSLFFEKMERLQKLEGILLEMIQMSHSELELLYDFMSRRVDMRRIWLVNLKCSDHKWSVCSSRSLDLSQHSQLRKLELYDIRHLSELCINMASLKTCTLTSLFLSSLVFTRINCDTVNSHLNVSDVELTNVRTAASTLKDLVAKIQIFPQTVRVSIYMCRITPEREWKSMKQEIIRPPHFKLLPNVGKKFQFETKKD